MQNISIPFEPHIYVIDDDEDYLDIYSYYLSDFGAIVHIFSSASKFINDYRPSSCECLLTDNQMPGITGLELQKLMAKKFPNLPVIIITGKAEVDLALDAFQNGVFDFIEKPSSLKQIQKKVKDALAKSMMLNLMEKKKHNLEDLYNKMSPREIEVLEHVLLGKMNKNIAHELKISEKTVEVHRNNIKNKLLVKTFNEVFTIICFLRNTHKDYISVLEKFDINNDLVRMISKCKRAISEKRCFMIDLNLTNDIKLENSLTFQKIKIIVKLINFIEDCEFSNNSLCRARNALMSINVM